jgi:hypothetical protein
MSKASKEQKALWRLERTKQKAEILFMVYRFLGVDRTLPKLAEVCGQMGVKCSLRTLEKYSVRFEWQKRILELNAVEVQRREKALATQVEKMNDRHVQFAQGLLGLAAGGLNFFQQLMKDTERGKTLAMSIPEVVQLYRTAQTGERLARGEATSRVEVWIQLASTVVREFALIFLAVNELPDSIERKAEFIRLSDDMMRRYYSETSRTQLETYTQREG